MRGGVRGLVKVNDSVSLEVSHRTGCGRLAAGQRREMVSLHNQLVEVLLARTGLDQDLSLGQQLLSEAQVLEVGLNQPTFLSFASFE